MTTTDKIRVSDVLDRTAREAGDLPAMKVKRGGEWQTTTWSEYRQQARLVARGFLRLGLERGRGVAIIGYNCPEWFLSDVGAILAGGFPAGIYSTSSAEQCEYIAEHAEAALAVVEDEAQLAKFLAVRDRLPALKAIVQMHGQPTVPGVYSWQQMLDLGAEVSEAELDARIAAQAPDDVCTLIYTSGTTGNPKGVMISHDNIVFTTRSALQTMDIRRGEYTVSYLPLSHIAEQVVTLHGPMAIAGCSWFAESMDKLGANLQEVRPHWFLGVPRVWEKIQEKMLSAGANNPPLKKKIVAWARTQGLKGGYADQRGEGRPLLYGLANKLVFSTVREKLGLDRCRAQITSAAPISKSTLEFFLALGLPVYEVFGMSECTGPATISTPAKYATGKAGWALPGTELKIADDGEICMRGRHVFKGYFKNPDATAESMDGEGWLHSGDIGTIDSYGFLKITDRKKDLLITAGGENVAPQILEGLLKGIPVISQAVVIGDAKKYLAALLTLDAERVAATAAEAGSPARDLQSASTCPVFRLYLQRQIDEMNQRLAKVQTIKRWSIVAGEFTIEGGELTPTMKIKRKVIREKYAAEIDALYDESADAAGRSAA
jgi:long-subunit acyl-CoA synthetase (AMP-forming)